MKIKDLCWAFSDTVMTFILGYIMFFGVDQEYENETEKMWYHIICGFTLCVMFGLCCIGWSTAIPERDNDNEG